MNGHAEDEKTIRGLELQPKAGQQETGVTYSVTPAHFGFTKWRILLFLVGSAICYALGLLCLNWIIGWIGRLFWPTSIWFSAPWNWESTAIAVLAWGGTELIWWSNYHYSIQIDDTSARMGQSVVRKGHVRYVLEKGNFITGHRLVLSEHRRRCFGRAVIVPKGLPEYEQIKSQVSTWVVNPATE